MKTFAIKTTTTMKEYNAERYWIDDLVPMTRVKASSVNEALQQYRDIVGEYGISISNYAIKSKSPMYRDIINVVTGDPIIQQIGYVLTGKTEIAGTQQYINLWVEIMITEYPNFL